MKKKDIEKLSKDDMLVKLVDCEDALLNLRIQKSLQQLEHTQKIRLLRKDIAQLKTLIREFDLGIRGN